jgi:hypothetical protein
MHRTLFALTLAAYLLAPSSFFARLRNLVSGPVQAYSSRTLDKAGPGLDPSGSSHATEEGPGLDPDGATARTPTTEEGPGLDPYGRS